MIQTETIKEPMIEASVLEEVVHWIKTLKEAGVSADTAATVTTEFFLTASAMGEDEEDEYYDE